MAKAQRVGGLRTAGQSIASPEGESNLTPSKRFKHEFQSAKSRLVLSLGERTMHWGPTGSYQEEYPKTKSGTRLDMITFEDNYFGTNDDELAEKLKNQTDEKGVPRCRTDGPYWCLEEMRQVQRDAEAAALRERLSQDPELAKLVFKPGESEDFEMPLPPTA